MIRLLLAICLLIEGVAFYLYNRILFASCISKIKTLLVYFLAYTFVFLSHGFSSYNSVFLNIVFFLSANLIILIFLYKLNFFSALVHALLISCFSIISEVFVGDAFLQFAKNIWGDISNINNLLLLSPSVLVFFSLTVTAAIIQKKIATKESRLGETVIIILLSAIVFAATIINYLGIIKTDDSTKKNYYLSIDIAIFILLLIGFMIMYNYMHHKEIITARRKILSQIEKDNADFIKEIKDRDYDQRILIHDIKKHLTAIQIMTQNGNFSEAGEYIQNLTESTALSPPIRYCGNDYMNSILYKYKKEAEQLGIDFSIDANSVDLSTLDTYDLTVIMCNLLDNSVEAAQKVENGHIKITLSHDVEKNITLIIIVNSSNEKAKFIQGIPQSNKHESRYHGLGIKSVLTALGKYNGDINMYQDENNDFHTVILLNGR